MKDQKWVEDATIVVDIMATPNTETRLGTLLIDKGLITPNQLNQAIDEQLHRKQEQMKNPTFFRPTTIIGEILVEMGFISQRQLSLSLAKQKFLRKVAFAVAVTAPLLTGCGGGGGGGDSSGANTYSSQVQQQTPNSNTEIDQNEQDDSQFTVISRSQEKRIDDLSSLQNINTAQDSEPKPELIILPPPPQEEETAVLVEPEPEANDELTVITEPDPEPENELTAVTEPEPEPEAENELTVVTDPEPEPESDDELTVITEPDPEPEDELTVITEPEPEPEEELTPIEETETSSSSITVSWAIPTTRENTDPLDPSEIAGYQILIENIDTGSFQYIYIADTDLVDSSYIINDLENGTYQISIAVEDQDGLYSDFTTPITKDVAA